MRLVSLLAVLALALPAAAQEKAPKKTTGRAPAHSRPTPQQIRKFNELEKNEPVRGRSPNSAPKKVRAPSPK